MKSAILLVPVGALVVGLAWSCRGRGPSVPAPGEGERAVGSVNAYLAGASHYTAFTPSFRAQVALAADQRSFLFKTFESDSMSGSTHESSRAFSVDFSITRTSHVTSHQLVFGGFGPRGFDRVVAFAVPVEPGSLYTARAGSQFPLDCEPPVLPVDWSDGTPFPPVATETRLAGGEFVEPVDRVGDGSPFRCDVLVQDLGGIVDLEADPDGRYVLILGGLNESERTLYRADLAAGSQAAKLLSSADEPWLRTATSLWIGESAALGRFTVMTTSAADGGYHVVGTDLGNDGDFEHFSRYDPTAFVAAELVPFGTPDFIAGLTDS